MKKNEIDLFADELGHIPLLIKPKRRRFEYKDGAFVAYCHGLGGICCAHNHRTVMAAEKCLARHRRLDPKNWGYIKDEAECENKSTLVEVETCDGTNFTDGEKDKQYWEGLATERRKYEKD